MTAAAATAPICEIDFYCDTTIANPVVAYKSMLATGPVVWLEKNDILAVCGYNAVMEVLRDHERFQSGRGVSIDDSINKLLIGSTLNSDPPAHDVTRKITIQPMLPKQIRAIRDRVDAVAQALAKKLVDQKHFDAATELAPHLPLTIVRDLVGLGDYGKEHMLNWGAATFELMGNPGERRSTAIENMMGLRNFLEDPATLENLSPDGWARLATQRGIESGMSEDKAVELMRDYIAPSLDTTISAIGYGIMLFATHPDQWTKLRHDRKLMRNAIEEIVRLNTPIRSFTRYVNEDSVIATVPVKKGSRVLIVYGSANRDPDKFERPDEFNIERSTTGHVGFSQGVHACLGMNLARLEMDCLFNALADRVERFEISGNLTPGINSTIHSLSSIPVTAIKS